MPCRSGINTTVTFGTSSGYTPEVKSIDGLGLEREVFDCTHMGSAASVQNPNIIPREYRPGDLATPNQLTLQIHFDPDELLDLPIDGDPEQITITWRRVRIAGVLQATPASLVFDGFVVSWNAGNMNFEGLMEGTVVLQVSGDWTVTVGVAA